MRVLLAVFVLVCGLAGRAEAVSLRDLIDLSKQGISDDILIALVEAEKSVFHLGAADVKSLKGQGVSDRLVIFLLQTPALYPAPEMRLHVVGQQDRPLYREEPPLQREEAAPQVVIVERVEVETVAVPVYVPVHVRRERRDDDDRRRDRDRPVYWGYDGKLRPDAWTPAPVRGGKDKR